MIVVGTDGSESSLRAVDRAATIAAGNGAKLVLACAYHPMREREVRRASTQLGDRSYDDAYKVRGSSPAEDVLREASGRAAGQGARAVRTAAVEGDPVDVLVDLARAEGADVVVVGNRGLNSIAGRLLGSVASDITHRAPCDVVIVHTTSGR